MECLPILSLSAMGGSILSGLSGAFSTIKSVLSGRRSKKNKEDNNYIYLNSNNTNTTKIGSLQVNKNEYNYRESSKIKHGNKKISK